MAGYSDLEAHIIRLFNECAELTWQGNTYYEITAFKPTTQGGGGECKTDVYVSLRQEGIERDKIKISVKKLNADFIGNKLNQHDVKNFFGDNWAAILTREINSISDKFTNSIVLTKKKLRGITDIYYVLGWKLEIANKSRELAVPLLLPRMDIINKVYRGVGQPNNRLNAFVNGKIVADSGIADYLLEGNISSYTNTQDIMSTLEDFSHFQPPTLYLIFTANNYRVFAKSADGPRTLAVAVNWNWRNNELLPVLIFDQPLTYKGQSDMLPILRNSLISIGVDISDVALESLTVDDFNIVPKTVNDFN